MRVLVGICGIGLGHSVRQSMVIGRLQQRGARVAVFSSAPAIRRLNALLSEPVPCFGVTAPWVFADRRGIDWARTERENQPTVKQRNREAEECRSWVPEVLGGPPNVVVSDYEPASAAYAYQTDTPLVTLDQQSKFLGYGLPDVAGLSRVEERSRLAHFFPHAARRLAVSFYPIDVDADPEFRVDLFPAPVRPQLTARAPQRHQQARENPKQVLIYLSPYGPTNQPIEDLIEVLRRFPQVRFRLYDPLDRVQLTTPSNVGVSAFEHHRFLDDLVSCDALVTTAGHTLLTEACYLRLPVYTMALPTYDQHYCAKMVTEHGVGQAVKRAAAESLAAFLADAEQHRAAYAGSRLSAVDRVDPPILDAIAGAAVDRQ